jgi:Deoxyribodipyrimidine photolyase
MSEHKGLFWFRNDLRLEDNIALSELAKKCHKILPNLYI